MAIKVEVAEDLTGWETVILKGFQMTRDGSGIRALFKVPANGELASAIFNYPIKKKEFQPLLKALGITKPFENIVLPEVDDEDKLGFDKPILGKLYYRGKWLSIKSSDFKEDSIVNSNDVPF